jgi:hypothetical protein
MCPVKRVAGRRCYKGVRLNTGSVPPDILRDNVCPDRRSPGCSGPKAKGRPLDRCGSTGARYRSGRGGVIRSTPPCSAVKWRLMMSERLSRFLGRHRSCTTPPHFVSNRAPDDDDEVLALTCRGCGAALVLSPFAQLPTRPVTKRPVVIPFGPRPSRGAPLRRRVSSHTRAKVRRSTANIQACIRGEPADPMNRRR